MNWTKILQYIPLLPYIAAGINQLHADSSHETRSQLALEALGLADAGAQAALPQDQAMVANVSTLVSSAIQTFAPPAKPAAPAATAAKA